MMAKVERTADLATFRNLFEEFDDRTDAKVELALEEACKLFARDALGTLYLTAHVVALDKSEEDVTTVDSGNGSIQSQTVGDLALVFRSQDQNARETYFVSTKYGRKYLNIERRTPRRTLSMFAG